MSVFAQQEYRCRLEWGRRGALAAAARGDILVVVDVLRFSTTVVTAVHHGVSIYPCLETEDVQEVAHRVGAEAGIRRLKINHPPLPAEQTSASPVANENLRHLPVTDPAIGRIEKSLSPGDYVGLPPGTRIALHSLNGSVYGHEVPYLFVGALVNAQAVSAAVAHLLETTDMKVTINACGERWSEPDEDGPLRPAIEDYLGAGAILSGLPGSKSPEARLCETAFLHSREALLELLLECGSGRELIARGQEQDVRHAARLNLYTTVPMLSAGWFVEASPGPQEPG